MSEPKFTLGPWRVIESGIIAEGRFVIAEVFSDPLQRDKTGIEESMANAHLIAAAPELYEALEFLLTCKHGEFCDHYREAERKARAALKKARGE